MSALWTALEIVTGFLTGWHVFGPLWDGLRDGTIDRV